MSRLLNPTFGDCLDRYGILELRRLYAGLTEPAVRVDCTEDELEALAVEQHEILDYVTNLDHSTCSPQAGGLGSLFAVQLGAVNGVIWALTDVVIRRDCGSTANHLAWDLYVLNKRRRDLMHQTTKHYRPSEEEKEKA